MTDKNQCQHSSWKSVSGGKVACEICGAVGEERHYIKLDDPDLDLSDTFTRMFALTEHWMKRARAAEAIIGGRADYHNELPEPYAALADAQEREARLRQALEKLARLGAGDRYGNSIGNEIAQEALGVGKYAALLQPSQAPAQGEPDKRVAPPKIRIEYQLYGRCFWHVDCTQSMHHSGIMREVKREGDRSLIQCLHCGKQGYYPKGGVGKICVDEVAAAPKEHDHD